MSETIVKFIPQYVVREFYGNLHENSPIYADSIEKANEFLAKRVSQIKERYKQCAIKSKYCSLKKDGTDGKFTIFSYRQSGAYHTYRWIIEPYCEANFLKYGTQTYKQV